jgi:hypothetical protein
MLHRRQPFCVDVPILGSDVEDTSLIPLVRGQERVREPRRQLGKPRRRWQTPNESIHALILRTDDRAGSARRHVPLEGSAVLGGQISGRRRQEGRPTLTG